MRALVGAGCGLLLLVGAAAAQSQTFKTPNSEVTIVDGAPRKITIVTTSPSQEDVRILGRTSSNERCGLKALPNYRLLKSALHGSVCSRDERAVIKHAVKPGPHPCMGVETMMRVVYFRPAAGYVGSDRFQYAILDPLDRLIAIADVSVTLTPPQSPSPASQSETAAQAAQPTGTMDRCSALVM
ncbi:MAG: hypothetical protein ABSC25_27500 [Roseiarcus sp.]|jgi:hypothetical protein